MFRMKLVALAGLVALSEVSSFSTSNRQISKESRVGLSISNAAESFDESNEKAVSKLAAIFSSVGNSALLVSAALLFAAGPVHADEYGRETEAPTIFTGETTMICTKRGPLGACLKTEFRTEENDNDKSEKYFQKPTALVKRKDNEAREAEVTDGNSLIERLKKQTEENREKNELIVQQKTFMNDQSASFGPFDGQTLILNADGKGFTLLANPQAMRLKKDGFIKDKRFLKQPTQEELDNALVSEDTGLFGRVFGD